MLGEREDQRSQGLGRGVRPRLMEQVVEARRSGPVADLKQIFDRLGSGEIDRRRLEGALSAGSRCHSPWVRRRSGAAARLELHASERVENGMTYVSTFCGDVAAIGLRRHEVPRQLLPQDVR